MSELLIVNRHGVFHTIPERLAGIAQGQGARVATPEEKKAYRAGATRVGKEAISEPPAEIASVPFADYDELNVDQVVARLKNLAPDQVATVWIYESATKQRKGVLEAIEDLTGGEG